MTADHYINEQSVQALYLNLNAKAHDGYGIDSGCTVSINTGTLDAPDTLQVASGTAWTAWTPVDVAQQNVRIDEGDPDNPRKDIVYLDDAGNAQVAKGVPGSLPNDQPNASTFQYYQPPPKDLDGTPAAVLAEVYVPATAASITAQQLEQRRSPTPTQRIAGTTDFTATGGADPAADVTVDGVVADQTQLLDLLVAPRSDPAFNADYAWNIEVTKSWDDSQSVWDVTGRLTWDTDPGPGNDVQMTAYATKHL